MISFTIRATEIPYKVLCKTSELVKPYPLLISDKGRHNMCCVSPIHCRSFLVGRHDNGRYIISKGNGLSYSTHPFLYTPDMPTDVWGLLLKEDALRDFYCGQDVQALRIKTNQMECVLELDYPIYISQTDKHIKPALLQYSVECPYRIADAAFMPPQQIRKEVAKWKPMNRANVQDEYLIAADVLIRNLRILHDNKVLHNALTFENVTWALELLDFEICHTPQHPYSKADYARHVCSLYDREIIDVYRIIIYIAGVLHQQADYSRIDALFREYGFDLTRYVPKS